MFLWPAIVANVSSQSNFSASLDELAIEAMVDTGQVGAIDELAIEAMVDTGQVGAIDELFVEVLVAE